MNLRNPAAWNKEKAPDPHPAIVWNARDTTDLQASYYSGKTILPLRPTPEDIEQASRKGLTQDALAVSGRTDDQQLKQRFEARCTRPTPCT